LTSFYRNDFGIGDTDIQFSIQSISKVLTLALAITFFDEHIWNRVGVEPSATAFNSLIQLEYEKGKPRNPFINSGAIVIADMLVSCLKNPKEDFLSFVRLISGSSRINFNPKVAQSEKDSRFRNAALANFLKSFGDIKNDVDTVLYFYFHQCSIEMTCKELAHSFFLLTKAKLKTEYRFCQKVK
jgi:glutaminase